MGVNSVEACAAPPLAPFLQSPEVRLTSRTCTASITTNLSARAVLPSTTDEAKDPRGCSARRHRAPTPTQAPFSRQERSRQRTPEETGTGRRLLLRRRPNVRCAKPSVTASHAMPQNMARHSAVPFPPPSPQRLPGVPPSALPPPPPPSVLRHLVPPRTAPNFARPFGASQGQKRRATSAAQHW